jgi:hypothetical protein
MTEMIAILSLPDMTFSSALMETSGFRFAAAIVHRWLPYRRRVSSAENALIAR